MKTFTVEGRFWRKDIEVDNSIHTDYADMCFEAMTQGVEAFLNGGEYEEEYDEEPNLGLFMVAYEKGHEMNDDKKSMALTEHTLYNAGYYDLAEQFREISLENEREDSKKRRRKS